MSLAAKIAAKRAEEARAA